MKTKPITPYERLRKEFSEWAFKVKHAHRVINCVYPAKAVEDRQGYRLDDLAAQVAAASKLGYDTHLVVSERGLETIFVKRPGDPPWVCDV